MIYDLQAQVGCSIQISKWSPRGPLVVQAMESNHPIAIITKVGSVMPLVHSAAGRLFASFLPEQIIRPLMEDEWQKADAQQHTLNPKNWDEFLLLKQSIQSERMALAQGDLLVGINAVGFPVFNAQGMIDFCVVAIDTEKFLPLDAESEKLNMLRENVAAMNRYIHNR